LIVQGSTASFVGYWGKLRNILIFYSTAERKNPNDISLSLWRLSARWFWRGRQLEYTTQIHDDYIMLRVSTV
jgi:hypothetical protein